jgi:7-cyano-7-deazaguanine synthase
MKAKPKKLAVAIVSGGLDSVTLAYFLKDANYDLHMLAFDYGQRHVRELYFAHRAAERLGATFDVIDLSSIGALLGGSSLTDMSIPVPDGHYEAESMKSTVVPNRNAIMLTIAYGVAVARQANVVATGVHGGDHYIYPDCRPEFVNAFDLMQRYAVDGFAKRDLHLYTPFIAKKKQDIVTTGHVLGVPFYDTWSCYKGGERHCGTCGTCVERKEAFILAGVPDSTDYESDDIL